MLRKMPEQYPTFSQCRSLSGTDNRRVRVIRGQFWFGWTWKEADNPERISGEFTERFQTRDQG
jgi:hypothetical protein